MAQAALARMPRRQRVHWRPLEREAWRPPERLSVTDWCERNIELDHLYSSDPGPWRTWKTPYLREPMDAFANPRVERITVIASTQVGKSVLWMNMLGFAVDQAPGPAMLIAPNQEIAERLLAGRIRALFEASDELKRHVVTWGAEEVRFDRMMLYQASGNSPAALASKPCCYLFFEELDKLAQFSGKEADPVSLAEERTRTFWKRKIVKGSTPTTRDGYIFKEYGQSDKRQFYVPCPHCGHYQVLEFRRIQFEGERDPKKIRSEKKLKYECIECDAGIDANAKARILQAGVWVPEGAEVAPDGTLRKVPPPSSHRGYRLNCLYSPWLTWSEIAAKFLESKSDPGKLMTFVNSWLAEPWEEKSETTEPEKLASLAEDYAVATVPEKALHLTAGADVQQGELYYVIRAWGIDLQSWLVQAGRVERWETLENILFRTSFEHLGHQERKPVTLACIDAMGHRTDEVYAFTRKWDPNARPIKGEQRLKGVPYYAARIERTFEGKPVGGHLWHLDTTYYKDKLHRLIHTQPGDPGRWALHRDPSEEYLRQVCSEHRALAVNKKTGQTQRIWRERPGAGGQTHWLDCEVYALLAADMLGAYAWKLDDVAPKPPEAPPPIRAESSGGSKSWFRRGGSGGRRRRGWM